MTTNPAQPTRRKSGVTLFILVIVGILLCLGLLIVGFFLYMQAMTRTVEAIPASPTATTAEAAAETPTQLTEIVPAFTPQDTRPPVLTPTPASGPGATWERSADGMRMVFVPEGEFTMGGEPEKALALCLQFFDGCDLKWFIHEQPVHTVTLDAFWMDQSEVTNAMYAVFLNEMGNQDEGGNSWLYTFNTNRHIYESNGTWEVQEGFDDHPVIEVSWYGARAYCAWADARLPTEAEWEKAARGGLEGRMFPWGDELPTCGAGAVNGAQSDDCGGKTIPVMTFSPNGYGLYDMAGNVWEWVNDLYSAAYYSQSIGLSNPQGPEDGEDRVLRGGSWASPPDDLRPARRLSSRPDMGAFYYGFRCARSPASP
jgi:formylglycine-generating enzyme required for sulfatase activity